MWCSADTYASLMPAYGKKPAQGKNRVKTGTSGAKAKGDDDYRAVGDGGLSNGGYSIFEQRNPACGDRDKF
jgi:hypothetical protein